MKMHTKFKNIDEIKENKHMYIIIKNLKYNNILYNYWYKTSIIFIPNYDI